MKEALTMSYFSQEHGRATAGFAVGGSDSCGGVIHHGFQYFPPPQTAVSGGNLTKPSWKPRAHTQPCQGSLLTALTPGM